MLYRQHIELCPECAQRAAYTQRLLMVMRKRCARAEAPDHLRRRILAAAIIASPPLMLAFLQTSGTLQLALLAILGITMLSTAPVMMAVVLENSGDDPAAANGTYFMLGFAARALILLLVGALGDSYGLRTAYYWCAGFAAFGLPFVWLLPESTTRD